MSKRVYIFFISFFAAHEYCICQASSDTLYQSALNIYTNALGINTHLYNGYQYIDFDHAIKGNPFFENSHFSPGSINYDGIYYNDVKIFYDILNDDVVIAGYDSSTQLILKNEKITAFSLLNHDFIKTTVNNSLDLKDKFFDVLYNGNSQVLARRKKVMLQAMRSTLESERVFTEIDYYFLRKQNNFYRITNAKDVLDVFSDEKAAIKKYIKKEKLKFNAGKESFIVEAAKYYDTLNASK